MAELGTFEKLGAWLHVWTPPRDAEVPPPPRRGLVAGALAAAVLAAVAVLVVAPAIQAGKDRATQKEQDRFAAFQQREERRLQRDQVLHSARVASVSALEAAITRDARSRGLDKPVIRTDCIPYRPDAAAARKGKYECVAVTADERGTSRTKPGVFGYPFWARLHRREGRAAWCKINPRAAEGGAVPGSPRVDIPRGCDLSVG
jgi:hypothetical protein